MAKRLKVEDVPTRQLTVADVPAWWTFRFLNGITGIFIKDHFGGVFLLVGARQIEAALDSPVKVLGPIHGLGDPQAEIPDRKPTPENMLVGTVIKDVNNNIWIKSGPYLWQNILSDATFGSTRIFDEDISEIIGRVVIEDVD